jgi:hypothetical protein
MRILDKHKDYYDYLAGIYGIDNTVFFDRRGSVKLSQDRLIQEFEYDWSGYNYEDDDTFSEYIKKKDLFAIVEAGYNQYLIRASNIRRKKLSKEGYPSFLYDGDLELVHVFDDHKHYFTAPVNFYPVMLYNYHLSKDGTVPKNLNYANDIHISLRKGCPENIENPIFIETKIPSVLDAHAVYVNIFDYISSKADFDIIDTRDDVAKAVDHGFDKKTSFRNV